MEPLTTEMVEAGAEALRPYLDLKWKGAEQIATQVYLAMRKGMGTPYGVEAHTVAIGIAPGRDDGIMTLHVGGSVVYLDHADAGRLAADLEAKVSESYAISTGHKARPKDGVKTEPTTEGVDRGDRRKAQRRVGRPWPNKYRFPWCERGDKGRFSGAGRRANEPDRRKMNARERQVDGKWYYLWTGPFGERWLDDRRKANPIAPEGASPHFHRRYSDSIYGPPTRYEMWPHRRSTDTTPGDKEHG